MRVPFAGFEQGSCLLEGEGFAGPARLAGRGAGEVGDIRGDVAAGLGVADRPLERQMAHPHRRGTVGLAHVRQRGVDMSRGQLPQPCRPHCGQDRLEHILVLADGLRRPAGQPALEPVLARSPERVVRRGSLAAGVQLGVQLGEPVGHGGPGRAGDLAADALAVGAEAEADRAAPAAGKVAVPGRVRARPGVVEVHRVAAPAPSCGHAVQDIGLGHSREPFTGATCRTWTGTGRHRQARGGTNKQLNRIFA